MQNTFLRRPILTRSLFYLADFVLIKVHNDLFEIIPVSKSYGALPRWDRVLLMVYLSPSRSGPETGFVAIVLFLSLSYCLSNNELRRLASYYATSNFYVHEFFPFAPYVTHITNNERTHTSLYLCFVGMCVVCTFGHFNIWSWPNVQYEVFESLYMAIPVSDAENHR